MSPENNHGFKPEHESAQIVLRLPAKLKSLAVKCASSRNQKLSPWLMEAIAEKCERDSTLALPLNP